MLVNNASTFYPDAAGDHHRGQWESSWARISRRRSCWRKRRRANCAAARGLIVNIADIHGLRPLPDYLVYSTAKAALIHLTRALARELAPEVRVNAVAPGPVLWPESGLDEPQRQEIIRRTLLQRAGTPADVARAVRFFAADAPYVTGQVLAVDGGRSVRG